MPWDRRESAFQTVSYNEAVNPAAPAGSGGMVTADHATGCRYPAEVDPDRRADRFRQNYAAERLALLFVLRQLGEQQTIQRPMSVWVNCCTSGMIWTELRAGYAGD